MTTNRRAIPGLCQIENHYLLHKYHRRPTIQQTKDQGKVDKDKTKYMYICDARYLDLSTPVESFFFFLNKMSGIMHIFYFYFCSSFPVLSLSVPKGSECSDIYLYFHNSAERLLGC